jgi:hypothetical protein
MAFSLTTKQLIWTQYGLTDLRQEFDTIFRTDNNGANKLVRTPRIYNRSKHIDIQYHYTREKYEQGNFELVYVESNNNLADLLTKPLAETTASSTLRVNTAC